MIHQPVNRNGLAYALVILLGFYLLALVSPSITGGLPLWFVALLASLLPLVLVVWLIVTALGKPKKATARDSKSKKIFSRILTGVAGVSAIGAIASSSESVNTYLYTTAHFFWENVAVGFLFAMFAAIIVLSGLQNSVYWPFWNKADKANADERQKSVRQRVFEKAYGYNVAVLVLAFIMWSEHAKLNQTIGYVVALLFVGMPAIIAAWQKDS